MSELGVIKMSTHGNAGSNNGMWKGENVGYGGLHDWVKRHISKPIDHMCEICHKVPYSDLANVTGIYSRDFANWQFQCRRCHWLTPSHRQKQVDSHKGKLNFMFGKRHSREIRKKISQNTKEKMKDAEVIEKMRRRYHNPIVNQNLVPHNRLLRDSITGRFMPLKKEAD